MIFIKITPTVLPIGDTLLRWFLRLFGSNFIAQTAVAAVGAETLNGCQSTYFFEVFYGSADGGFGYFQFACDGRYRRPTFAVLIGSVTKVKVNRDGSVRYFIVSV